MNIAELASAAVENGWSEASRDVDGFGDYRSASWHSPQLDQIVYAVTVQDRARPNVIDRIVVSTTDPLGWAATQISAWTAADGDLDDALKHLVLHGQPKN